MAYHLSKKARIDLEGIWLYTFKDWSFEQADIYVRFLLNEMEKLAENPARGRNRSDLKRKYRSYQVKSHFIFYQMMGGTGDIKVIRILHKQMDIERRLKD